MTTHKQLSSAGALRSFSRREFARIAGLFAGALALPGVGCGDSGSASSTGNGDGSDTGTSTSTGETGDSGEPECEPSMDPDSPELPSLGGAPDTPEGRAIAAFVDIVIPGSHRDPLCAPGALDVDAAALFFDPSLPAAAFVPLFVTLLDTESQTQFSKTFAEIRPSEREQVFATLLEGLDLLDFAVMLAKLAFFSSVPAGAHLGYPGPNAGYVNDPDLSFGTAMSTEITADGNLP